MHKALATAAAAALTTAGLIALPIQADAHTSKGTIWDNCTSYNRTYHHGVGRVHAHDHTSGTPVRNFLHSDRKYHTAMVHNNDLDRDGDHIACEKA